MTTENPQEKLSGKAETYIKRLRISVTQEDIDTAHKAKADGCMIATALKREHPELKNIWVDKNQIRCTDVEKNCIYTFDMHPLGRVKILKWDSGEEIEPFELWIRRPVVRKRHLIRGAMRPKQTSSRDYHGPVAHQTKERRAMSGRDRVFGRKLWDAELAEVRRNFGPPPGRIAELEEENKTLREQLEQKGN